MNESNFNKAFHNFLYNNSAIIMIIFAVVYISLVALGASLDAT